MVVSGRNLVQYVNGSHLLYQWHAMSACLNFFFQGEGMVMLSEEYFGSFLNRAPVKSDLSGWLGI